MKYIVVRRNRGAGAERPGTKGEACGTFLLYYSFEDHEVDVFVWDNWEEGLRSVCQNRQDQDGLRNRVEGLGMSAS